MSGLEKSKYIFLRLARPQELYHMVLDYKLLLENSFYLNVGWNAYPTTEIINGNTLNNNELIILLKNFNNRINYNITKQKRPDHP
tara:strand:- start:319 stop:573 length:255 start_codon:yes stop_codon:yes gene_type:complete